jgi:hypothetical protein
VSARCFLLAGAVGAAVIFLAPRHDYGAHAGDSPVAEEAAAQPDWKAGFERVYRLELGQVLKRVAPPFIPERHALCVDHNHIQGKDDPAYMIFHATPGGPLRDWGNAYGGDGKLPLRQVLAFPLGMAGHQFEGPDELLSLDLMGDWVVDPDAPLPAKLAAITGIIREAHGRLVRFERRQPEREVIVATGQFKFDPLPDLREPKLLHLFTGFIDPARGGQQTGTSEEFFQTLETFAGQAVVDETTGARPKELTWVAQTSAYLADKPAGPGRQRSRQELLDNVAKQTGMKFQVTRRKVPVWVVVEGPAAG